MTGIFTKENFARLTVDERAVLMYLQMNPGGSHSSYLPDDCAECNACGQPTRAGWCLDCSGAFDRLVAKCVGKEESRVQQQDLDEETL